MTRFFNINFFQDTMYHTPSMIRISTAIHEEVHLLHQRNQMNDLEDYRKPLETIRHDIIQRKDAALVHYTETFDGLENSDTFSLTVAANDIKHAYKYVDTRFVDALKRAHANISAYHQKQIPESWTCVDDDGREFRLLYRPIEHVGLYVPGGRATYPSTVLMNAIPAKIAGVTNMVVCTPPNKHGQLDPSILVAADICGVETIIKAGGAQAIFALSYGTESVPKVDKIVGPGNNYVTLAKQMVYGLVDIDKPAGPSEVLVYVPDVDDASIAAAELLAQLEHDPNAIAVAVSESNDVLHAIKKELEIQLPACRRKEIIQQSIKNSILLKTSSCDESIEAINAVASEHLVLLTDAYDTLLDRISHAGSIFCGKYSPVTIGDYYAGTNHVLPTGGAARFSSPLGVMDFMKYSSAVAYQRHHLEAARQDLKILTDAEGFDAHFKAVDYRLK